jgi:hypothetical protein
MSTAKKSSLDDSASVDADAQLIPVEYIERRIYLLREHKVMLDSDLADLYQVTTGNLTWPSSGIEAGSPPISCSN